MSAKKNKALAAKLIDDLLGKEDGENSTAQGSAAQAPKKSPAESDEGDATFEIDTGSKSEIHATAKDDKSEHTYRLPEDSSHRSKKSSGKTQAEVKPSVGRFSPARVAVSGNPTEAILTQSENLRIAQQRILELEQELQRLRSDSEELAAAGETMRRKADEMTARAENLSSKYENLRSTSEEERDLLSKALDAKSRELEKVRTKLDEMDGRLSNNIQKIRVRERELENRLELVKMEGTALIRNKDEIILDLKRQIDQMNLELDNFRSKGQELNRQLGDKQELLRRTVKALRIALSMLEGDEADDVPEKKAK